MGNGKSWFSARDGRWMKPWPHMPRGPSRAGQPDILLVPVIREFRHLFLSRSLPFLASESQGPVRTGGKGKVSKQDEDKG